MVVRELGLVDNDFGHFTVCQFLPVFGLGLAELAR